jgi:hypothetical protein
LECDGHFFFTLDIVLENRGGSALVTGEIGSVTGTEAWELQLSSAYLGKNRTLKKRKGAAPAIPL